MPLLLGAPYIPTLGIGEGVTQDTWPVVTSLLFLGLFLFTFLWTIFDIANFSFSLYGHVRSKARDANILEIFILTETQLNLWDFELWRHSMATQFLFHFSSMVSFPYSQLKSPCINRNFQGMKESIWMSKIHNPFSFKFYTYYFCVP